MDSSGFLKTAYGLIPKSQLKKIKIPEAPKTPLFNYLPNLFVEEVDEKSSCLGCFFNGKYYGINK